jgi:formamidopyrimidine-DNA glycosylase
MFEIPEFIVLAEQFNQAVQGKVIVNGSLGNSPHKFVWHNLPEDEFAGIVSGKTVGATSTRGKWMFTKVEPGYVLVIGECGGKLNLHQPGAPWPMKYHLSLTFTDGAFLTHTTQMWGAMELYKQGEELEREYIKDMKITPLEDGFTYVYFCDLIEQVSAEKKQSTKGLLTQDQTIPGLGNAIAQDILFKAGIHPKRPIGELAEIEKKALYAAVRGTIKEIINQGGRYDEIDLFDKPGGYVRLMDKNALSRPCPICSGMIEKISYLGGTCYLCPNCQVCKC